MKTYKNLCALYYDLDEVHGATQELPFYTMYAQEAQGPILEPMCGTGNFLIPLTQAGFEIEGFDASSFMLERLHVKAEASGVVCTAWQGLLQNLSCSTRYKLLFIPNASFNLLVNPQDIFNSLQSMYTHLAQDGVLVFELLTVNVVPEVINIWTRKERIQADGSSIVVHSFTYPIIDNVVTTTHRYEHVVEGLVVQTETELYQMKLHDPMHMEERLKEVGFSGIKKIKAFDRTQKADLYDDLIVFECIK